jgi:hypothetical protein
VPSTQDINNVKKKENEPMFEKHLYNKKEEFTGIYNI